MSRCTHWKITRTQDNPHNWLIDCYNEIYNASIAGGMKTGQSERWEARNSTWSGGSKPPLSLWKWRKSKTLRLIEAPTISEARVSQWSLGGTTHTIQLQKRWQRAEFKETFLWSHHHCPGPGWGPAPARKDTEAQVETKNPCSIVPRIANLKIALDPSIKTCFAIPNADTCEPLLVTAN